MAATTYWHDGSSFVDISGRMLKEGWQIREDAEEGSAPTSQVPLDDQTMDFAPVAFHPYHVLESTSSDADDVLVSGFLWEPDLSRGGGGGDGFEPLARMWSQGLTDENHLWDRIAMKGSDNNRPAETDVERITWLLGTSEAAIFDDVTTYVHTAGPVAMDANDYTGQKLSDVMRDCSEASGKNWWAKTMRITGVLTLVVWYGRDSSSRYDSDLGLSNDDADLTEATLVDETSLVWPLDASTKVTRDYGRVYCGLVGQFEGGRVYRHNSTTHATYFAGPGPDMHRDTITPMPNVKSLAKAQARGDRMLLDMATPDVRVTTKVRLPAAIATKIRAGMRIPVKVTYDPELYTWTWCRILNCTVTPAAAGTQYDLDLEMTPTGPATVPGDAEPGPGPHVPGPTSGGILYQPGNNGGSPASTDFQVYWNSTGDNPGTGYGVVPRDATNFDYIGTIPNVQGWEVLATAATLDLALQIDITDVASTRTFTFELRKNGSVIATDVYAYVGGLTGIVHTFNINVTGLAVVAGDLLTTHITTSALSGLTVPNGTGTLSNVFQILNTSTIG